MCFSISLHWLQGISASLNILQASLLEKQKVQMAVASPANVGFAGVREGGEPPGLCKG